MIEVTWSMSRLDVGNRAMVNESPRRGLRWLGVVALLGWLSLATGVMAQTSAEDPPGTDPLRKLYAEQAAEYRFQLDGAGTRLLERSPEPIMRWNSPNDWSGDIFVWTDRGRPEILGCILAGPRASGYRPFFHEFHALSLTPLPPQTMARERRWEPTIPGITLTPLKETAPPEDSRSGRLRQLRQLAREFTAHSLFEGGEWELRLLPQPLYRYPEPPEGVAWVDGALFGFVLTTGTDLELVVLLEARRENSETTWRYAPVRMTNKPAWIKHRDVEVYRVDGYSESAAVNTGNYTTFYAGRFAVPAAATPVESP